MLGKKIEREVKEKEICEDYEKGNCELGRKCDKKHRRKKEFQKK
jgi:hypothetical protein